MIKHIKCNMFDSGADIFCHQVNCQGEMNTGVAAEVRKRYPWVFAEYKKCCNSAKRSGNNLLGICEEVFIDEDRAVVNIFAQENYGYDGKCYTDYKTLKLCLEFLADMYKNKTIAFPYKMGCHRGGGDWEVVYKLICDAFADGQCDVLICEYDEEIERQKLRDRLVAIGKEILYE